MSTAAPGPAGLYDPRDEHDACGVGFVVDIQGRKSHEVIEKGLRILLNLLHRGACGSEANTGDGFPPIRGRPGVFAARPGRTRPAPGAD